ncbi:MAG: hypothetical protein P4L92_22945 [Rudaea sp.]|nr:hypothetical protein [Rudaea sp.]
MNYEQRTQARLERAIRRIFFGKDDAGDRPAAGTPRRRAGDLNSATPPLQLKHETNRHAAEHATQE